jgi:hypothetical protein
MESASFPQHGALHFSQHPIISGLELIMMISRLVIERLVAGYIEVIVAPAERQQPWTNADATEIIRALASSQKLRLTYTQHARERLDERDLIISDVLYVLKNGFVYDDPQPSTQGGLFKYRPQSRSPNSGGRTLKLVVVPDPIQVWIKVVTVMWADE